MSHTRYEVVAVVDQIEVDEKGRYLSLGGQIHLDYKPISKRFETVKEADEFKNGLTSLDDGQVGQILAALRLWQRAKADPHLYLGFDEFTDISQGLDDHEIDELCEELNCGNKEGA